MKKKKGITRDCAIPNIRYERRPLPTHTKAHTPELTKGKNSPKKERKVENFSHLFRSAGAGRPMVGSLTSSFPISKSLEAYSFRPWKTFFFGKASLWEVREKGSTEKNPNVGEGQVTGIWEQRLFSNDLRRWMRPSMAHGISLLAGTRGPQYRKS